MFIWSMNSTLSIFLYCFPVRKTKFSHFFSPHKHTSQVLTKVFRIHLPMYSPHHFGPLHPLSRDIPHVGAATTWKFIHEVNKWGGVHPHKGGAGAIKHLVTVLTPFPSFSFFSPLDWTSLTKTILHNVLLLPDCYTHFLRANLPVNFTSKYYWTKCWKTSSNQQKWISYHSTSISIGSMFIRYGTCSVNKHLNWKKKTMIY